MSNKATATFVFIFVFVTTVFYSLHCRSVLPDEVASHFGASGQPEGWSSRDSFVAMSLVTSSLCALLFWGTALCMAKVPDAFLNLPHKEFWLAPERRQETHDYLTTWSLGFASATMLLLLDMFRQTVRVNLGKAAALEHPWVSLVVYLAFVTVWIGGLSWRFARGARERAS
ncbi:MAG: DUF1648 domain-containing protein [Armatimonadetes bacterium]|nr:DUF1648 domain-containing protein [Armatimonadota bacterium]NCP30256.1 DUF1648 domain-containing protein [Armatimonadota bacterium]NDK16152.1 DUF1648 domain-containing protein [Armatimonadota bacterium]